MLRRVHCQVGMSADRLRAALERLKRLVAEREKGEPSVPYWLVLEWIDDLFKRPAHETKPCTCGEPTTPGTHRKTGRATLWKRDHASLLQLAGVHYIGAAPVATWVRSARRARC